MQMTCTFAREGYKTSLSQYRHKKSRIIRSSKNIVLLKTPSLILWFHLLKDLWLFVGLHATLEPEFSPCVVLMKLLVQIIVHIAFHANDGFKLVREYVFAPVAIQKTSNDDMHGMHLGKGKNKEDLITGLAHCP